MIHMHFWIDKRSQGCGFNGRHLVPPSISGIVGAIDGTHIRIEKPMDYPDSYINRKSFPSVLLQGICDHNKLFIDVYAREAGSRRAGRLCGGVYPKLMVTPVHRFQVIGGCEGFVRRARVPSCRQHPRFFVHRPSYQENVPTNNNLSSNAISGNSGEQANPAINRSMTLLTSRENSTVTPRAVSTPTTGLKCGVWAFFAVVTFFIAGAKFYFHGGTIGMEALAFCSFLILILIIGGLVSLYETITSSRRTNQNAQISVQISNDQNESSEEQSTQVPNSVSPINATEVSPPPYHVAIMLPPQNEIDDTLTIIRDSPPPSYEKAVT